VASAIEIDGVSKRFRLYHDRNQSLKATLMRGRRAKYEEFMAVDDVSLDIAAGESFGFVGRNGSGKSTLLKVVAGIYRPDKGAVTVNGKLSALLELGAGFHPELSGRENVYLNGSILGLSRKELERRFDEIVDFAELHQFIDMPVKNYSSGMYVRLGFSVAINVDPDVLLVDEVLAVGDEMFQRKCSAKFAELREAGTTIVLVSHSLGAIRSMCDRAMWIDRGVAKAVGPAGDVIDEYLASVDSKDAVELGGGVRWGTGEARITNVSLLDQAGKPTHLCQSGGPATFEVEWETDQPVPEPVFAIVFYTTEGVVLAAPNTKDAGVVPKEINGTGATRLTIPEMPLLPNSYDISVSLTDVEASTHISNRHRVLRFDVVPGDQVETMGGLVTLGGNWSIT
jgi:ABC-type polysaccharide/polyol phosphate transport system ATPase subunit